MGQGGHFLLPVQEMGVKTQSDCSIFSELGIIKVRDLGGQDSC
jgi:hypothetical protein